MKYYGLDMNSFMYSETAGVTIINVFFVWKADVLKVIYNGFSDGPNDDVPGNIKQ